jgi:hypothetical protein
MNAPIRLTATGNVGQADGGVLHSVTFTGGSDAATLIIKYNGSGGTQLWPIIKAPTVTTVHVVFRGGIVYTGQLHATITGTSPEAGFEIGV